MPDDPLTHKVTRTELRAVFNRPEYQEWLAEKTTQRVDVYEKPAPPSANQREGTLSHVYDLFDNRTSEHLATIHRFKNQDGTIGGSGLVDPYALLVDGVYYIDP